MYIALERQDLSVSQIYLLSPNVMRVSNDIWLIDLTLCESYWQHIAQQKQLNLSLIYEEVLSSKLDNYRAVYAESALKALLLLFFYKERKLSGYLDKSSKFGERLYQEVSWKCFWQVAFLFLELCKNQKWKEVKTSDTKNKINEMRATVMKLGVKNPWQFKGVGALAIRRRYGSFCQLFWEMSFSNQESKMHHFPWEKFCPDVDISTTTYLDHPLKDWEIIKPALQDSFLKLTLHSNYSEHLRIVSLKWCLRLLDASTILVTLQFRHPHCLHNDPSFETALLQAYYAFSSKQRQVDRESLENTDDFSPPIISWDLSVDSYLQVSMRETVLFDEEQEALSNLLELENKLPIILHQYEIDTGWTYKDSYLDLNNSDLNKNYVNQLTASHLLAISKLRPLYLYKEKYFIEKSGVHATKFTERTMNTWWNSVDENLGSKTCDDYYRLLNGEGQALWAIRLEPRKWHVHGIYA